MKKYNATQEAAADRMTHATAPLATLHLLADLNLPAPSSSGPNARRWLDRTQSKRYFMLSPGLVALFDIPLVSAAQTIETNPEAEYATTHDTLAGITRFIEENGLSTTHIMQAIYYTITPIIPLKASK